MARGFQTGGIKVLYDEVVSIDWTASGFESEEYRSIALGRKSIRSRPQGEPLSLYLLLKNV
jgi:hypothetical protein